MFRSSKKRIVLIEDDEILSVVLYEELERAGFAVFKASDGEEGLKLVRTKNPDLVLLDLALTHKSGYEVLSELKDSPDTKSIPVIILSVLSMDQDIQKAFQLGAADYFVKSQHTAAELIQMVKDFFVTGPRQRAVSQTFDQVPMKTTITSPQQFSTSPPVKSKSSQGLTPRPEGPRGPDQFSSPSLDPPDAPPVGPPGQKPVKGG